MYCDEVIQAMWLSDMSNLSSCKFWYVLIRYEKVVLRRTYPCIYSISQSDSYVWRLIFKYRKEIILTLHLVNIYPFHLVHYTEWYRRVKLKWTLFVANKIRMFSPIRYNQHTNENQPLQYFTIAASEFRKKNSFAKKIWA